MLEYVRSSFKVICHVRPKLSCRACETIVRAPMPSLPIEPGGQAPACSRTSRWRSSLTTFRCTGRP